MPEKETVPDGDGASSAATTVKPYTVRTQNSTGRVGLGTVLLIVTAVGISSVFVQKQLKAAAQEKETARNTRALAEEALRKAEEQQADIKEHTGLMETQKAQLEEIEKKQEQTQAALEEKSKELKEKSVGYPIQPTRNFRHTPISDELNSLIHAMTSRDLTYEDLRGKSRWALTIMRNTPYARHGYKFSDARLKSLFDSLPWYFPETSNMDRAAWRFSKRESRNCRIVSQYQELYFPKSTDANPLKWSYQALPASWRTVDNRKPLDLPLSGKTICIDPGHSKMTVGAHGRHTTEYQICWAVAQKLKRSLVSQGANVVLTKASADENVTNEKRAAIANYANADLFLRLHCDAGSGIGIATFYPAAQGSTHGVRGPRKEVIEASRNYAYLFHTQLIKVLSKNLKNRGIRTDNQTAVGNRQGGALTGSIYSRRPVLLVEMCVLTSPTDEQFILSERGQNLIVHAMTAGVVETQHHSSLKSKPANLIRINSFQSRF